MKRIFFLGIIIGLLVISCATIPDSSKTPKSPIINIESEWDGRELIFCKSNNSYQKYFMMAGWKKMKNYTSLPYEALVGKKGVVEGMLVDKRGFRFWIVNLDDGTKIIKKDFDDLKWGFINKTCFIDELENATELINEYVWLNKIKGKDFRNDEKPYIYRNILNDGENQWTTFERLQKVKVIDALPFNYGNSYSGIPIYLKILADNGETGFIRYGTSKMGIQSRMVHYFQTNPIKKEWDKDIINLIKSQKIKIGMTKEQVLISWGEPDSKNRSVGSWGVHEQWVYGKKYLYFENNKLTSFQD